MRAGLMFKVLAAQFRHEQGIIHRDLKPANILVGPDLEPKVLDFGRALELGGQERLSAIGEVAGTPEYLSPDQARGARELDARTGVFSLGAVLGTRRWPESGAVTMAMRLTWFDRMENVVESAAAPIHADRHAALFQGRRKTRRGELAQATRLLA